MGWFPSLKAIGGTKRNRSVTKGPALTLAQLKSGTSRLIDTFPYDYGKIFAASDPKGHGLLNGPLTEEEKKRAYAIVVGCGLSGLTAARELLRAGFKVDLADRATPHSEDEHWEHAH